jgi:hypothetical protein
LPDIMGFCVAEMPNEMPTPGSLEVFFRVQKKDSVLIMTFAAKQITVLY